VNLLKRLETNLTVEAAGHLEQLRLCQTEYVSLLNKQSKLEYRLKIYLLVVVQHVVTGAMEVIHLKLGDISLPLELLLEIYMTQTIQANGVNLIFYLLTITIPQENTNHVQNQYQLLIAQENVVQSLDLTMILTNIKVNQLILLQAWIKYKLK